MRKVFFIILVSILLLGCGDSSSESGGTPELPNPSNPTNPTNPKMISVWADSRLVFNGWDSFRFVSTCAYKYEKKDLIEITVIDKTTQTEIAKLDWGRDRTDPPWLNPSGVYMYDSTFWKDCNGTRGDGSTNHVIDCGDGDFNLPTDATIIFKCTDETESDTVEIKL